MVYSFLSERTGLAIAALRDCQVMVAKAIERAIPPDSRNTIGPILMRYAKLCSQSFMTNQQSGTEMRMAIKTSRIKSFDRSITIPVWDEPKTLRIPISFTRCWAMKAESPKSQRQAIKMDRQEKNVNRFPNCWSARY